MIFSKIFFLLFLLTIYAYVTSIYEVMIILSGYLSCVFVYYYGFNLIRSVSSKFVNYVTSTYTYRKNTNSCIFFEYPVSRKPTIFGVNFGIQAITKIFSIINIVIDLFFNQRSQPLVFTILSSTEDRLESQSTILTGKCSTERCRKVKDSILSKRLTVDINTLMNVKSPGFTSRIVDKATESALFHIKYPAVKQISTYRFDKSALRQLSKISRADKTPWLRIASQEPCETVLNDINKNVVREAKLIQDLNVSRKNYYREMDKSGGNIKKFRRNNVKNLCSTIYCKRSRENHRNGNVIENSNIRCNYDCDLADMMIYNSSMNVGVPNSSWNYSKKRKVDQHCEDELFVKTEKYRKIHSLNSKGRKVELSTVYNDVKKCSIPVDEHLIPEISNCKYEENTLPNKFIT